MIKFAIDGSQRLGTYRVECECGDTWSGEALRDEAANWSPALPIAECCVHLRLQHPQELLDLRFTERFNEWLRHYWELASLHQASRIFGIPENAVT